MVFTRTAAMVFVAGLSLASAGDHSSHNGHSSHPALRGPKPAHPQCGKGWAILSGHNRTNKSPFPCMPPHANLCPDFVSHCTTGTCGKGDSPHCFGPDGKTVVAKRGYNMPTNAFLRTSRHFEQQRAHNRGRVPAKQPDDDFDGVLVPDNMDAPKAFNWVLEKLNAIDGVSATWNGGVFGFSFGPSIAYIEVIMNLCTHPFSLVSTIGSFFGRKSIEHKFDVDYDNTFKLGPMMVTVTVESTKEFVYVAVSVKLQFGKGSSEGGPKMVLLHRKFDLNGPGGCTKADEECAIEGMQVTDEGFETV